MKQKKQYERVTLIWVWHLCDSKWKPSRKNDKYEIMTYLLSWSLKQYDIKGSPFFECFKSFSLAEHTGTFDTCVKSPRVLYFLQKV